MIFDIGYLLLVIALVLSIFGIFAGIYGGQKRVQGFIESSFHAVYAVSALILGASAILWYGLLANRFEISYIYNHSERALPTFYKFAAIWGGQAGSLLFWALVLAGYSAILVAFYRTRYRQLMPYVNAIMLATSLFFLILLIFSANPFEQIGIAPEDGRGLNPLLQNYWMVIHPVMLYLGYVGLAVPFAFAIGALLSRRLGNEWVRIVRRWTLVPWMFLSAGILMGSQWAYMELGWGGYWAWDPVENASFIPWLTATAFLHSILIQERKDILKVWNLVLIAATYFLVILGTFTTRSGIISSVHSFAESDVGIYFLVFMVIIFVGFIWLLFDRLPLLRSTNTIESPTSRETAFLVNNWLFTGLAFTTLWGTFFPMFSEIFGERISVAKPWFDKVNGPLFLLLIIFMGIGPLFGWRRTSMKSLGNQLAIPLAAAALFAAIFSFFSQQIYPIMGLSACVMVLATTMQEFVHGIRARRISTEEGPMMAIVQLVRRNGQRYGGYIVHLGIVMMGIAIIGNEFYLSTTTVTLTEGESINLAGYNFQYDGMESGRQTNLTEVRADLTIRTEDDMRLVGQVSPRRNIYDKAPDQPTSEVGLRMSATEDLYVVLNGWDNGGTKATFSIFVNPLTVWLWIGGLVLVFGTFVCLWPHPTRKTVPVSVYSSINPEAAAIASS